MPEEQHTYKDCITINSAVMVGKPLWKVPNPIAWVVAHLTNNPDLTDLLAAYPELTVDDVKACLQYANCTL